MKMNPEVREALLRINFIERAKKITENHCFDYDNTFEDYDNNEVIKILNELGYKATYNKSEDFFKVAEKLPDYQTRVHIKLKYGIVELMWYLFKDNKYYDGSVWSVIKKSLEDSTEQLIKPNFHSYDDLKNILKEAFLMYEDFKRELIEESKQS